MIDENLDDEPQIKNKTHFYTCYQFKKETIMYNPEESKNILEELSSIYFSYLHQNFYWKA